MAAIILDACGILNLYASGQFLPILSTLPNEWFIPAAVEKESQRYRQPDPDDPEKLIVMPIDLIPAINAGVLVRCDCETEQETELYIQLAARIGDDGESMGLAIAKCRGWSAMTDDKKARKIAAELGVAVVGTTEIMKQWFEIARPCAAELRAVLEAIERFANYTPARGAMNFDWWVASLGKN